MIRLASVLSLAVALFVAWSAATTLPLPTSTLIAGFQQHQTEQRPKGQISDLGRPTEKGDEVPPFDYELYFPGKWEFEWRVPESPIGPAGIVKGSEIFAPGNSGKHYTSAIEAVGPEGPFTVHSVITYEKEHKVFARYDRDSRGFETLSTGRIGGDMGGFYTIHYETAPFEMNGHTVQLRMTTRLVSPVNFKVNARISVDGGPFTNFGNPWWRKEFERPSGK